MVKVHDLPVMHDERQESSLLADDLSPSADALEPQHADVAWDAWTPIDPVGAWEEDEEEDDAFFDDEEDEFDDDEDDFDDDFFDDDDEEDELDEGYDDEG